MMSHNRRLKILQGNRVMAHWKFGYHNVTLCDTTMSQQRTGFGTHVMVIDQNQENFVVFKTTQSVEVLL